MNRTRQRPSLVLRLTLALVCVQALALPASAQDLAGPTPPNQDRDAVSQPDPIGTSPETALRDDPALLIGRLDNGLRYVIQPFHSPPGQVRLWLHVNAGPLHETTEERGAARLLRRFAFLGSEHFPADELARRLAEHGVAVARDLTVGGALDHTVYKLVLRETDDHAVDTGLLLLADIASRLDLPADKLDAAVDSLRRERSNLRRETDYGWVEASFPGTSLAEAAGVMSDQSLDAVTHEAVAGFYRREYGPDRMTLLVVGDIAPDDVRERIGRVFSPLEAAPRQDARRPAPPRPAEPGVAIDNDPSTTRVSFTSVVAASPHGLSRTVGELRSHLVDTLASIALQERLERQRRAGQGMTHTNQASSSDLAGRTHVARINAIVAGPTRNAETAFDSFIRDIRSVVEHGFGEREIQLARRRLLAHADQIAELTRETTSLSIMRSLHATEAAGGKLLSPEDQKRLAHALVPTITTEEIHDAARRCFDPAEAVFVITTPPGVFTEADADSTLRAALADEPSPVPDLPTPAELLGPLADAQASPLLARDPQAVERTTHDAARVTSAWLDNGVRVHHRRMARGSEIVLMTLTLAGGEIEETAANRGATQAAATAWRDPALPGRSTEETKALLGSLATGMLPVVTEDAVRIRMQAQRFTLDASMAALHALLVSPTVSEDDLAEAIASAERFVRSADTDPGARVSRELKRLVAVDNDPRRLPPTTEQIHALTPDLVRAWLDRLVRGAPIEVAIVGDVTAEAAIDLAARYLGSLPERPRISADTFKAARAVAPIDRRLKSRVTLSSESPAARIIAGFPGPDEADAHDARVLRLAAEILLQRMNYEIRHEEKIVYSITVDALPQTVYPGTGLFLAAAAAPAGTGEQIVERIHEHWINFSEGGLSVQEVDNAKRSTVANLLESMELPMYWASELSELTYRGSSVDTLLAEPDAIRAIDREDVLEVFNRYYAKPRIDVVVEPEQPGSRPKGPAGPAPQE